MSRIRLIVAADEPALFFASIEDAERSLEAVDVEAGVYGPAYGPAGEVYTIEPCGQRARVTALAAAPRPEEARALVLAFLAAIKAERPAEESLEALLLRCEPYIAR